MDTIIDRAIAYAIQAVVLSIIGVAMMLSVGYFSAVVKAGFNPASYKGLSRLETRQGNALIGNNIISEKGYQLYVHAIEGAMARANGCSGREIREKIKSGLVEISQS